MSEENDVELLDTSTIHRLQHQTQQPTAAPTEPSVDVEVEAAIMTTVPLEAVATEAAAEAEPWRDKAPAKQLLCQLMEDDSSWVHDEIKKTKVESHCIETIRSKEPLFRQYLKKKYSNFWSLKTSIDKEKLAVLSDEIAFDKENEKWPINGTLANQKPCWQDSEAQ